MRNSRLAANRGTGRGIVIAWAVLMAVASHRPMALAQTATATLSGTVADTSGGVMPGAEITVTNAANGLVQKTTSNGDGIFSIPLLPAGNYTLLAQHAGFSPVTMQNVVLELGAHVALNLKLKVGDVKSSVSISADAGQLELQTESGERSDVITNREMRDMGLPGRSFLYLTQTIPGVVAPDYSWGDITFNGARGTMKEMSVDGASNVVTGALNSLTVGFDPEVVGEMKVLTSNYQAEFGKAGGGFVQMTTRSGTKDFHGALRYYRRDGDLNANNFFNNEKGIARPVYRYNYYGYDFEGPVILPHARFNHNRDKLFFFWSQQYYRQFVPGAATSLYMPTVAERGGDFSHSTDGNGNKINVIDPNTGSPFPGNIIPKSRFYQYGQNILNVLPLPNTTVGGFQYNYNSVAQTQNPSREDILRLDYNITPNTRLSFRYIGNSGQEQSTTAGAFNLAWNFPLASIGQTATPKNLAITLVHVFSPTLTNEFILGLNRSNNESYPQDPAGILSSTYGLNLPLLYPNTPGQGYLPSMTFSGIANQTSPSDTIYPFPRASINNTGNIVDNLSKVQGSHMIKVGIFMERGQTFSTPPTAVASSIAFGVNANNPLNTGDPYANALLGIYSTFQQSSADLQGRFEYNNVEPYVQDTWKVTHSLTLDVGLRMTWEPPQYDTRLQANYFVPSDWNPAQAVQLYQPVLVGGSRRAAEPGVTQSTATLQNTLSAGYIGLIVPGSGNPYNGIVQSKNGYYPGGFPSRGVQWGPRFGFAWDPRGKGNTVIRGGYGISYDRPQGNIINTQITGPPGVQTPELLYGYLSNISSTSGVLAPSSIITYAPTGKIPNVQSFSLGIQRNIGFGTVIDVAYTGTLARHLLQQIDLEQIPYGATFQRSAQDPSQYPGGVVPAVESALPAPYAAAGLSFAGDKALAANFLVPYPGYSGISYRDSTGSSNYNALQVTARRHIGHGLTFGMAYSFSKAFDTASADFGLNNFYNTRGYDYALATFDRTNVLTVNYVYDLPKAPLHFTGGRAAGAVINNWHVSGLSSHSSGAPFALGMTISGITTGQRILGTYSDSPAFYRVAGAAGPSGGMNINPAAYYAPGIGSIGPYPQTYLRQPGTTNHDITFFKNIPLWREQRRYLQLRVEMFNAFNHTEFSSINAATQLTANGAVGNAIFGSYPNVSITNNLRPSGSAAPLGQYFGEYNAAVNPRTIQLGVKLYF